MKRESTRTDQEPIKTDQQSKGEQARAAQKKPGTNHKSNKTR